MNTVKKQNRWTAPVITGALAMVIGLGTGTAITAASVEPETITETQTVTEEVEIEVTPDACIEAIDLADTVIGLSSDSMYAAVDALTAYRERSLSGMEEANVRLDENTTEVDSITPNYHAAKDGCRNASI